MQDFPANSQKAKARPTGPAPAEGPEKIEPITSGTVKRRKRGLGRQFKETFVEGSARSATEYMITDVVVPAIKDTIVEALQGGIDRLFNGESRGAARRTTSPSYALAPRIDYGNYSRIAAAPTRATSEGSTLSRQSRARGSFDSIIIPSRREAEDVLERMYDVLSRYGKVEVSVLLELTNIKTTHTDFRWGWTSLQGARLARQSNGGYMLDLPEPEPLD